MKKNISLDYTNILDFISFEEIEKSKDTLLNAFNMLESGKGKGNSFLGWYDPEKIITKNEIKKIREISVHIRENYDAFVVLGIGGSYLGARAVITALSDSFENEKMMSGPKIYYSGFNLDSSYNNELLELIKDKNVAINVISKSGTTTETALSFRIFYDFLKKRYKNIKDRIYVTTDKEKGALKQIAINENFKTFIIPDNVGGRFSVLTPVGLLPIAVAGKNIDELLNGALDECNKLKEIDILKNPSSLYALIRHLLYKKGKIIEILANFSYKLNYTAEWWKQLFGESEGKENKGIFPASVNFTTDLHSLGQLIQDGVRNIFETFLNIEEKNENIKIPELKNDPDKFNFLSGNEIEDVNRKALEGTKLAHKDGGIPNMTINIPKINEYFLGQLIYYFEKSVALGGYMLNVNPFDQPGVEQYKKNMFALLNKKGYENENKKIETILKKSKKYIV